MLTQSQESAYLDGNLIVDHLDGRLPSETVSVVRRHLDGCEPCSQLVTTLALIERKATPCGPHTGQEPSMLPRIGTLIGRYAVRQLVGYGGMGVVYAAHDPKLGRMVALKLLRPTAENSRAMKSAMERESRIMAGLSCANVATVYDIGEWQGRLHIALEFAGGTLREWLKEKRTWREVVAVFIDAGRGLAGLSRSADSSDLFEAPQKMLEKTLKLKEELKDEDYSTLVTRLLEASANGETSDRLCSSGRAHDRGRCLAIQASTLLADQEQRETAVKLASEGLRLLEASDPSHCDVSVPLEIRAEALATTKPKEAQKDLTRAIRLCPTLHFYFRQVLMAQVLVAQKRFEDAGKFLELVERDALTESALVRLGQVEADFVNGQQNLAR